MLRSCTSRSSSQKTIDPTDRDSNRTPHIQSRFPSHTNSHKIEKLRAWNHFLPHLEEMTHFLKLEKKKSTHSRHQQWWSQGIGNSHGHGGESAIERLLRLAESDPARINNLVDLLEGNSQRQPSIKNLLGVHGRCPGSTCRIPRSSQKTIESTYHESNRTPHTQPRFPSHTNSHKRAKLWVGWKCHPS